MAEKQRDIISLIVSTSNGRHFFKVDENLTVKELKCLIFTKTRTPVEWLQLSHNGTEMEDNVATMKDLGFKDETEVSLVVDPTTPKGSGLKDTNANPIEDTDVENSPFGIGAWGGLEGLSSLGATTSYLQLQQRMQAQLLRDPQFLQQVLSNPFVKSFMDKPEYLTQLMTCFPEMNKLMEQDPEVSNFLSQTDLIRQTNLLIAENPSILEALMEREKPESQPIKKKEGSEEDEQQDDQTRPKKTKAQDDQQQTPTKKCHVEEEAGVFSSVPLTTLLRDMAANPEIVQELYKAPHVQAMISFLSKNPALAEQFVLSHPMFEDNPQLREQMKTAMPFCLEMMLQQNNVEVFNPEVLQPLIQIQKGLDKLYSLAPNTMLPVPGTNPPKDNSFDTFVATFVQAMAQQVSPDPAVKYTSQMEQLKVMGFPDSTRNMEALVDTGGDVNQAVLQLSSQAKASSV